MTTGNGIPAEISRFSGNFDRKEVSNSKFRNFGFGSEFRCISPEFRCFSPKNDGNGWKMMENYVFMKKIENFGGVCPNYVYIDRL